MNPSTAPSRPPTGLLAPFSAATLTAIAAIAGLAASPTTAMLVAAVLVVVALLAAVTALVLHALDDTGERPAG